MAQILDSDPQFSLPPNPSKGTKSFDIAIAIDFGTDGLGVAYALPNDTKIHVHDKWKSKHYGTIIKPKTIILLNDNFEVTNVGLDAKHSYITLKRQRNKWMLFERFKMSLFEENIDNDSKEDQNDDTKPKQVGIKNELIAKNGKKCSSELVFVAAFKYIYGDCRKYLRKYKIKLEGGNIQWIITVPAIWNDEAKHKMKQWAAAAGLIDAKLNNFCKIVYEPDCASLAIQYYMKDKLSVEYDAEKKKKKKKRKNDQGEIIQVHDQKNDDVQIAQVHEIEEPDDYKLQKGDKYILVDVGGGTADIACHQMVDEFGVKEIYHPSGGKWGSIYIDDQYINLLESIFSKEWIDEFKKKAANQYVNMTYNFQQAKETFNALPSQNHNVKLPLEFSSFLESKLSAENKEDDGNCIERFVEKAKVFNMNNLMKYNDGYLEMNYIVWSKLFDYVIDPIINHIKYLLTNIPSLMSKHLKYICLVGGLSSSPYFRKRIRTEFGLKSKYKLDLIIPPRPILSVVQGAAFLGITPNFVRARRLQKTYGVVVVRRKRLAVRDEVSDEFIEENEFYNCVSKIWFIKNCVSVIAHKNEEIQLYGNERKTKLVTRPNNKQLSVKYTLFCSDMDEPKTVEDGRSIGDMIIHFDKDLKENEIMSEFIFSETMLEVYAWPKNTPHKRYRVEVKYNDNE